MSSSLVSGVAVSTTTAPGNFDDVCALSPLQQEIFSDPSQAEYFEQALWTTDAPLDGEILKQSWSMLVQRHPILRTLFRQARKQPVQVIRAAVQVSLTLHSLNHEAEAEREEALEQVVRRERMLPLDIAKGPLFRLNIFRFSENNFKTLLTYHPILLDRQSVEMLHLEVSSIYSALLRGEAIPDQDSPAIKDFILWLKRQDSSEASRYWEQSIHAAPVTYFPTDHPSQSAEDLRYEKREISLAPDLAFAVTKLADEYAVSVSAFLQGAWAVILARFTGASDITFGIDLHGRPSGLNGSERIAGKFAHTLPVRVQLQAGEKLPDLLHSLQQQMINVHRFSFIPLSQVWAAAGHDPSVTLFNTVFNETASIMGLDSASNLQFLPAHIGSNAPSSLTVEFIFGSTLQIAIRFQKEVFESATVEGLLASFHQLVGEIANNPQSTVEELKFLPANDRVKVLEFAQGNVLNDDELWRTLGIARPGSGVAVYVLERQKQLAPVNCLGEIAVSGIDASEAANAEKFVAVPFTPSVSTKLYLTGFRGRWKWDGSLEVLAELDAQVSAAVSNGYIAPVSEIEKLVAQVWQEVLGVEQAGLNDDFFDLGGHSLNTIQIRSRLSQRLGVNVPLKTIFANSGLEAQARAVSALTNGVVQPSAGIPKLPKRKYYPVSHAQRRLWFLHRLDPEDRFYHTADYILLDGPLNQPAFEQAFHSLVERQEILRTSFTLIADEPVQCISDNTLSIPFHDLSALGQAEQAQTMKQLQEEVPKWLSNLEVPPVGALLVKLAEDKHIFILAIHHILSDEWSGQVVWRDLMELYSAACRKQSPSLPPIRVQYADFSVWQKERIEGGKLAESERYWLTRLSGEVPKLKLPRENSQNGKKETDLLNEVIESGPELAEQLVRIGQAQDATPFMVKLAVFKAFLARVTGQTDILLGSTTAGRDHPDIEPLIGLFVNVVALRTDLGGDPEFAEVLKRVKQSCVEAYAHQEYPFDLLVQRLAPARDAGELPLLQAFFADIPQSEPKVIEGLRFSPVDVSNGMAAGVGGRKLPVGVGMVCHDNGGGKLTWRFLFRADHFAPETAQRLSRQFNAFLVNLAKSPNAPLSEIHTVSTDGKEIPLEHITDRDEFPLAFNQRDMWFQRQIHTEPGLNNLGALVTLSGPLNGEFFRQALQAVVDRHDTLRTIFVERNGIPYQKVLASVAVRISTLDLCTRKEEEQAEILRKRHHEFVGEPYDFGAGPLFRAELIRLHENKHVLIFAFSHLVLDGVYMAELFEQLATSYEQLLAGKCAALPPLNLQYQDFAAWQEERLKQGFLEHHQGYWQQQLQPPLPAMSLPSDKDTRSVHSFELGFTQWPVRDEVFKGLKTFRKRYRTTMFRTVLGAFEVLLRKIVGEKELLLGIPFSSLPAHVSQVLGFFGHAVPVRITLDDQQPFTKVLSDVNKAVTQAQEHLEYPLCEAVRGMQINRDPQRPLFPVVVSQVKDLDRTAGELRMRMDLRPVHAGVYHLWLTILESKDALHLGFYYNREVLEGRPLAMIQECLNELLAQVAANPEAPIAALGIVSTAEREKVLQQLAGAISSPTKEAKGIVARIEEHAAIRPQATAAVCGSEELSYEQLNKNSNRLAHWLRAQGIGRESRVGVFGARGLEMLTTLLGVLKAGAAFVPLDPEHPDVRLNSILTKANINLLASSADLVVRSRKLLTDAYIPSQIICWHDVPAEYGVPNPSTWADQPISNPEAVNGLRDLAYVCHTSGSTGIPKGAMVEHRGMLNHLLAKINFLALDEKSVVAQNASHCFDISIWQFFAALLAGGRVVIYPPESLFHSGSMLALVEQDGVTALETVPSLLEMMLNELAAEVKLPRLRHLISNAELLPVPLSRRWAQRFSHVKLVNTYGATECSDDTTHQIVNVTDTTVRIPVGQSIAGAQHYVLDQELKLVPAGCAGQIAIAGDVVGRGYLANPAATARTFVPDPFCTGGGRLYLTGDLGRWNSAGELEFLGRTDNQVKVHGHRVELSEIEAALARVQGLRQVAVIVSEEQGSQRLLAYWVGDAGMDGSKLREHARKELPVYMVPNAFVQMTALPLTANGKVDRNALPKPTDANVSGFVPPRDEVEFKVARLWRDELKISAVGVFDNFFERGGHSLKAVSLINRLQSEFKVSLPLRTLFDHQTIDSLSRVIRGRCQDGSQSNQPAGRLVPLQAGNPSSLPLFLVHPHGGTVFCYQALTAALGDQVPVFGIQCRGLEEGEQPLTSIPDMAAEYIKDIRRVQPQGPYQIVGWSLGGPIAFEVARQLEAEGLKVGLLGIFDSAIPASSGKNLDQLLPSSISANDFGSEMSMASFARWFFRADERQFEGLSDAQIVDALKEMAQRAGMLPPDVSPDMLRRFVAVAISSGIALYKYQPENPVQTNVVLFRAAQSLVEDPQWWAPWTYGAVETIAVQGSHYDMVFPPAVQTLADALRAKLGSSAGKRGAGA